jgi:uncharacterized SAM-binding protein YcdF (DUF218 family)
LASLVWLGIPLITLLLWGGLITEKLLTEYALPSGLIWNLLWLGVVVAIYKEQPQKIFWFWLFAWLAWTLLGNRWLAREAMYAYEKDQIDQRPAGVYDLLVLLGGGLQVNVRGDVEVGADGQRVIEGAILYHAGKAKRIAVTGTSIAGYSSERIDASEAARRLLMMLDVPGDAIDSIAGRTTSEEMVALKRYLSQRGREGWRVGIVTSAFHIPRTMRLAESHQVRCEPIPVAFRTNTQTMLNPAVIIPDLAAVEKYRLIARELLGRLVGR